jgi:hypothetical protein
MAYWASSSDMRLRFVFIQAQPSLRMSLAFSQSELSLYSCFLPDTKYLSFDLVALKTLVGPSKHVCYYMSK